MNLQSQVVVGMLIVLLIVGILRAFSRKKVSSGQSLLWLSALSGALVLTAFPGLVDRISQLWGNLDPVSWISFLGLLTMIAYLVHHSTRINRLEDRLTQLSRSISFIEERVRLTEAKVEPTRDPSRAAPRRVVDEILAEEQTESEVETEA